jgi:NadR type nicotinamide-nucleotide adenylyltransferase
VARVGRLTATNAGGVGRGARLRVVVTGAPCTGKTTLAERLALRYRAPWSPEYARQYQAAKPTLLDASDVEPIARGQIEVEQTVLAACRRLAIHDTDLLSTVVYSRHYYGACPDWIVQAAALRRADLYLLLLPDVPWVPEDLQRDATDMRDELHALFRHALVVSGARFVDVGGAWEERELRAAAAVAELLSPGAA